MIHIGITHKGSAAAETMITTAASLPGQKLFAVKNITAPMLSFP